MKNELPIVVMIKPPIKLIESNVYALVIEDAEGVRHYFDEDGSYDGWSKEADRCNIVNN